MKNSMKHWEKKKLEKSDLRNGWDKEFARAMLLFRYRVSRVELNIYFLPFLSSVISHNFTLFSTILHLSTSFSILFPIFVFFSVLKSLIFRFFSKFIVISFPLCLTNAFASLNSKLEFRREMKFQPKHNFWTFHLKLKHARRGMFTQI